ncbi:Hypothetical predicted protein [Pelobates cultripes]|uniref:Reverse transcriptase domain-containing protein n=1 Tax=Pelobates cultripes TaxID=61616 RepID=A0AAD1W042_PELCU|nr:Hypothetical predicted protein [Pelobates cultripes]
MAFGYRRGYIFFLCLLIIRSDFFRERHTIRRNIRRGGHNKRHTGEKERPIAPIQTQSLIHNISEHTTTLSSNRSIQHTQGIQHVEENMVGHNTSQNDPDGVLPLETVDVQILPGEFWLVTMDVQSLYTSIDHNRGIEAVDWTLDKDPNLTQQSDTRKYIRELLTFILTENYFLFRDKYYKQIKGTAMGSNVAPT